MESIFPHVDKYIDEVGLAHWEVRSSVLGVLFHDEGEFIPVEDLGLSENLGFFRRRLFPDEPIIAGYIPEFEIRPTGPGFALVHVSEDRAFVLGDWGAVIEAKKSLERAGAGDVGPPLPPDSDLLMRSEWMTTNEAAELLQDMYPEEYAPGRTTAERLRMAGRRGDIMANNDSVHGWRFNRHSILEWAADEKNHKPGPKGAT